jgi:hypothetical protein
MLSKDLHTPIYDSGLIIRDRATLATLCIFYERVRLPWMPPESVQTLVRLRTNTGSNGEKHFDFDQVDVGNLGEFELNWDREMKSLFEASVLERLPAPSREITFRDGKQLAVALHGLTPNVSITSADKDNRAFFTGRVLHHLREDLGATRLFEIETADQREAFKALLAQLLFGYLLPAIQELEPDQMLEVREKVRDTREGFTMHLQNLSAEIDGRLQGGETVHDLARHARAVVETELVPDYREFRRQLAAERVGFWAKVLATGSKVFEIREPITSPKAWAEIALAAGMPLASLTERKHEVLSNKNLAFQFLRAIETKLDNE